jgi:hypothetical protein
MVGSLPRDAPESSIGAGFEHGSQLHRINLLDCATISMKLPSPFGLNLPLKSTVSKSECDYSLKDY